VRLSILGSGVVVPSLRRASSSYLVEAGGRPLLFDMGSGALRGLLRLGLRACQVQDFFFSHVHPDHTADLVPFLFACNYAPGWRPEGEIRLYGPAGFADFLESLYVPYPWLRPRGWPCLVREETPAAGPGWSVTPFPACHGDLPALCYRVEEGGKVLCYSGDTGPCPGLAAAARGAQVLLCECSVAEGQPPVEGHMTSAEVARVAREAGVGRVLLTHIYPASDEVDLASQVAAGFPGPVLRVEDGECYFL
jgi:ribonuclease BN (tRNA processing enzyme)